MTPPADNAMRSFRAARAVSKLGARHPGRSDGLQKKKAREVSLNQLPPLAEGIFWRAV